MKNYAKEYQEQKVNFIYSLLGLCFEGTTEEDANKFISENYEMASNVYWDKIEEDVKFVREYRFITKKQEEEIERICNKYDVKFSGINYEHALLFIHKYNKIEENSKNENSFELVDLLNNSKIEKQFTKIEETLSFRNNDNILITNMKIEEFQSSNIDFNIIKNGIDISKKKLKDEYDDIIKNVTVKYNSKIPKIYRYNKNIKKKDNL